MDLLYRFVEFHAAGLEVRRQTLATKIARGVEHYEKENGRYLGLEESQNMLQENMNKFLESLDDEK